MSNLTGQKVERDGYPFGWMIIWLLLALTFFTSPAKAQSPPTGDARARAQSPARVLPSTKAVAATTAELSSTTVEQIGSIGMTVSDMDRAIEFYAQVLSFEKVSDVEVAGEDYEHLQGLFGLRMRVVRMRLGDEMIELTEYLAPKGRPAPTDSRSNDRWFQHIAIITSDMDKAYAWLRQHRVVHASSGPQRLPDWNKAAGGIRAFYFKDLDNHSLEILEFPEGKGDPKWRQEASSGKLFLGIDHTAIVVSNTDESLRFYRDLLGLRVAGESENYGTEQEHLNNVFGARLRITSLRASRGPGIEFLEYLSPRDGRSIMSDERANDLSHWQTKLLVGNIQGSARSLFSARYTFVSSGVVELSGPSLGFAKSFLVRDPDGHVMQLIEKSSAKD
jgi:catechol 2,3-dioxygenase-like lactoylglutathione lyase family enzyme